MGEKVLKVSDFDFELPKELIAQKPAEPRDSARLMVLNREFKHIEHRIFRDIKEYLKEGDVLILNNTKVIPARLLGKKITGARIEVFLLEKIEDGIWKCLVKPGSKMKVGSELVFRNGLFGKVIARNDDGTRIIEFSAKEDKEIFSAGEVPLPPYIKNRGIDPEKYQTVYAQKEGAVAAPTAGLHFTKELLDEIKKMGVKVAYITLHVGLGTFRPVKVENIENHEMEEEFYHVPKETVDIINDAQGRIIAVGTTVVRTLETIARLPKMDEYTGKTDIFIYPPFEFKMVDALITNFHLPRSTLLMLVSAFAGLDLIKKAYKIAIEKEYRFFSFGDAMFIL